MIGADGAVEIPWWVIQATKTLLFAEMVNEKAEAFLAAPIYSKALERVTSVYLCPVDEVGTKKPKAAKKEVANSAPIGGAAVSKKEIKVDELSKDMLESAFGDDFDTTVGVPKEVRDELGGYTDDF